MKKSNKCKLRLFSMAIITFLIIPVILANIRYSPEEKSCNSLFDPVIPKDSSVYYENTAGSASKI